MHLYINDLIYDNILLKILANVNTLDSDRFSPRSRSFTSR